MDSQIKLILFSIRDGPSQFFWSPVEMIRDGRKVYPDNFAVLGTVKSETIIALQE